jgi:hypothetical protein
MIGFHFVASGGTLNDDVGRTEVCQMLISQHILSGPIRSHLMDAIFLVLPTLEVTVREVICVT